MFKHKILFLLLLLISSVAFSEVRKVQNVSERSDSIVDNVSERSYVDHILSLTEALAEQEAMDIEELEASLRELAENPINLNNTDSRTLERLFFLSDDQITNILLYVWHHPMQSLSELRMVYGIDDYTLRCMLPFVYVEAREKQDESTVRDWFSRSRHEVTMRLDGRNLTTFTSDPIYASLRYKLNASNRVFIDVAAKRDAGEKFSARSRCGIAVEVRDINFDKNGRFKLINAVIGDYRPSFGMGLAVNSGSTYGKSVYASKIGFMPQGLRRYSGTSSDFYRGAGFSVEMDKNYNISAFYSLRSPDSTFYHNTIGLNFSYNKDRLSLGLTVVDDILSDSLRISNTYYNANYFRGNNQFTASLNARYAFRRVFLLGEAAVSQNNIWGAAVIAGVRYVPLQDVSLMALYRYYSPHYDALNANTFAETSRPNDEHGGYVGADISALRNWHFSLYADLFAFQGPKYGIRDASLGYDWQALAEFSPSKKFAITAKLRGRRKGTTDTYSARLYGINTIHNWSFRTEADMSVCSDVGQKNVTYAGLVFEQVEYGFSTIPMVLQGRVEAFYITDWRNRIYIYENDVLYAFSIPAQYGTGIRTFLNWRYHISEHFALYLRVSDTYYFKQWAESRNLTSRHRPDVHLLLKVKY